MKLLSVLAVSLVLAGPMQAQTHAMAELAYGHGKYKIALGQWRRLAERGDERAQMSLGGMYLMGQGVPQDFTTAHMWISLSAANGDDNFISYRDWVAFRLTPDQLAEAQRRARVCLASNYQDCDDAAQPWWWPF